MPPRQILTIFGGTGFISRNFLRHLPSIPNLQVHLATRTPPISTSLSPHIHIPCDISNYEQVSTALENSTHVLNLVGILHESPNISFRQTQAVGVANIANAISATPSVKHCVHVSAIGANPSSKSQYAVTKALGEQSILSLKDTSPDTNVSILRPSIVFGPDDSFFNRFNSLASVLPFLPLVGGGHTRYQPVHVSDVSSAILTCLSLDPQAKVADIASGSVFELGGADILTFRQLMQLVLDVSGKRRLLLPIPFPVASAQGAFFEALHRVAPSVPPMLTRDQVELLRYDNVVSDGAKTFADLGISARGCNMDEVHYLKE